MPRRGTLAVRLPDGDVRRYGRGAPHSTIAIADWPTLRRITLNPDLALGEAWIDGTLTVKRAISTISLPSACPTLAPAQAPGRAGFITGCGWRSGGF